jgi:ABC-type nickel/cobalt efflux system permease component RcnA
MKTVGQSVHLFSLLACLLACLLGGFVSWAACCICGKQWMMEGRGAGDDVQELGAEEEEEEHDRPCSCMHAHDKSQKEHSERDPSQAREI